MGQKRRDDKVGALSHSGGNITMAASSSLPAYLTIGGQQYKVTSNLSVAVASASAVTLYMVYAVVSAGVVSLVKSTNVNSVGPSGQASWKLIGAFYTGAADTFGSFVNIEGIPESNHIPYSPTISNFGTTSSSVFYFARKGDSVEIRGGFTAGTTTAGQAAVSMPGSTTVSTIYTGRHVLVGQWSSGLTTAHGHRSILAHNASGSDRVFFGYISTSQHGYDIQNGDNLPVSVGYGVVIDCSVVVSGWSNTPLKDL